MLVRIEGYPYSVISELRKMRKFKRLIIFKIAICYIVLLGMLISPVTIHKGRGVCSPVTDLLQVQSIFAPIADKDLTGTTLLEASLRCVWNHFPDIKEINTPLVHRINGSRIELKFKENKKFNKQEDLLIDCSLKPSGKEGIIKYQAAINPVTGIIQFFPEKDSSANVPKKHTPPGLKKLNIEGTFSSVLEINPALLALMHKEDKKNIEQILSSEEKTLQNLASGSLSGKLVLEKGDEKEGRTVYFKLKQPVQYNDKNITILRLKGVRPRVNDSGNLIPYDKGKGHVRRILKINETGNIYVTPGDKNIAPAGTMDYSNIEKEFQTMANMQNQQNVETDTPVGFGKYTALDLNGEGTGYILAGLEELDLRISSMPFTTEKGIFLINNATKNPVYEFDEKERLSLFEEIGLSLRTFHNKGYFHRYPHWNNIGVIKKNGVFKVILRDLETTIKKTEQDSVRYSAALRFLDISRILHDLQLKEEGYSSRKYGHINFSDLILPFLEGYFHDLDHLSLDFIEMYMQCMKKDVIHPAFGETFGFSIRIGRLMDSYMKGTLDIAEEETLSEQHPYFGKILAKLYSLEKSLDTVDTLTKIDPIAAAFEKKLKSEEALSTGMIANIESILLTKPVILAFDNNIAALQSASPLSVFKELEKLKKQNKFRKIFKNLIIIDSGSPENLIRKIQSESHKFTDINKPEVFIFSLINEKEKFAGIASSENVHAAYINEQDFPLHYRDHYYPLVDIVALVLSKYIDPEIFTARMISDIVKKLNINLGPIEEDKIGSLIFTLIPKANKLSRQKLINRYAALKRLLSAA
ncbi:MAG: hypothetical protein KAI70_06145 [Candidatus Omnitrophica bacterium]|nr:hypothetical protein [Candidatus Omnitrophota bacterium]